LTKILKGGEMIFTDEQIEAIKAAALPIDFGSITIQIGSASNYMDIDVHNRMRIGRQLAEKKNKKKLKKINA
jgi:hypothetical protein